MFNLSRFRSALSRLGTLALALTLAACGGGGGSNDSPPASSNPPPSSGCSDCSKVLIALTDADGDFLSYTVDFVSLKLRRPNGTHV